MQRSESLMDEKIKQLEYDNVRLKKSLKEIAAHQAEIQKRLDEIRDLLHENEKDENKPVTDEDVKSLLKKYSRL